MIKEFKEFISRGNVMDLAVGVIIGSAFTAIVKSLVANLINPLIGIFLGKIDLSNLVLSVGDAHFKYGLFLNSVINKAMPKKEEEPEAPAHASAEESLEKIVQMLEDQKQK